MVEKKPTMCVTKMYSEEPDGGDTQMMSNEERQKAMQVFQKEQAEHLRRQHELDNEHNAEREQVLKLEEVVDEKVADAIRHAEEAI